MEQIDKFVSACLGGGRIARVFRRMEVAEEEIAIAKKNSPRISRKLHRCFLLLRPEESLESKSDALYRIHCREMLMRVRLGEDTRPGTDAELIAVLCDTSYQAPLVHMGCTIYEALFRKHFPSEAHRIEWTYTPEQLAAKLAEPMYVDTIASMRRRTNVADRMIAA